jgi:Rrf2 family protein
MKLSTRSRYGTRAMLDIARHSGSGATLLRDIAGRQSLPPKYLDHILSRLRKAGLVKSGRDRKSGYELMRPAGRITVKDILVALEGSLAPVACVDHPGGCGRSPACPTRDLWQRMKAAVEGVLDATTLQDLIEQQSDAGPEKTNYTI